MERPEYETVTGYGMAGGKPAMLGQVANGRDRTPLDSIDELTSRVNGCADMVGGFVDRFEPTPSTGAISPVEPPPGSHIQRLSRLGDAICRLEDSCRSLNSIG